MTNKRLSRHQRLILRRIVVQGDLVLDTPTCTSNGDTESPTDISLLQDSRTEKALLTGASIAGALRSYLCDYQLRHGDTEKEYKEREQQKALATILFGGIRRDDDGDQSPLIVHDAISSEVPETEVRDGVRIDGKTGTAWINRDEQTGNIRGGAKYDIEFLATGTIFPLYFELLIDKQDNAAQLIEALALSLRGLEAQEKAESGEIGIGVKKQRGFGRCHVEEWKVWNFDMKENASDRLAWLTFDRSWADPYKKQPQTGKIFEVLKIQSNTVDQRDHLTINATFRLDSSLLIRSGHAEIGKAPDVEHLKSKRSGEFQPVLSGTSLAGALRHRAERIVHTLNGDVQFVDKIFGFVDEEGKKAHVSRLLIHETVIKNTADLVQSRIAVDRFTGGAYHGALFDEQPVWGGGDSIVTLSLELRQPEGAEIGLLLLLLKDLWTSDLPIGGGSSIGRGRLQGRSATITHQVATQQTQTWTIIQNEDKQNEGRTLQVSDQQTLERFVEAFVDEVKGRQTA